jgi:hypothetical protein
VDRCEGTLTQLKRMLVLTDILITLKPMYVLIMFTKV